MADKKDTSKGREKHNTLDKRNPDDRNNKNARAAAAVEPEAPRISTDHL